MQYALMEISSERCCLIDAQELYALKQGTLQPPIDTDETQWLHHLWYGVYKPQPDFQFPRGEVRRHLQESVGQPLLHLYRDQTFCLQIDAVECSDSIILRQCGHCPSPHKTDDIAFAALVCAPPTLTLNNQSRQACTAFLQWEGRDTLSTVLNRRGLFAFTCEERRYSSPVTPENWRSRIDYKRLLKEAQTLR